jgi:mRNA interferase RelE/StbE
MINYSKEAEKFILSQGKSAALRIYEAAEKLPLGDVKRLQGKKKPPLYRLRVGDYRIIFHFESEQITVLRVDNRGDVYKRI